MGSLDLNQAEFLFRCPSLQDVELRVFRFSGREVLSQPFDFSIELVADSANLDISAPIGQPASLILVGRLASGNRYKRHIHGIIEEFVQSEAGIRHSRYSVRLVPTIKPLHFTRNSRIFQRKSAPQVTQSVMEQGRVPSDCINTLLHESYSPRDYCVQYQESDLNFVQRLWEEEGIFYFFEHQTDRDKVTLGDGDHAFETLPHYGNVVLRDKPHLFEEGFVQFQSCQALRPGATHLRDFKFKQPGLEMDAEEQAEAFVERQLYYFPGDYVDPSLGKRLAKVRLQEQQCQRARYVGEGNVRSMLPGYKFTLAGHRRRDCNQEYLIVEVQHEGMQPQALAEEAHGVQKPTYRSRVECIPAKVPFRPSRRCTPPAIPGVQTAIVVGPPGEEIHCDEHGRVKVKFHWDRDKKKDDSSSCWIRVSQPWGGAGQGGMFIPRVGQEVVVQFLEGDPDRPLIVGRVYNGENMVPHGLPAAKNISTIRSSSTPGGSGFNEIKFDDSAGNEHVFFHAQKDQREEIGNNHSIQVGNDQTQIVGGKQTETVKKDCAITNQEGNISITVSQGTYTVTATVGEITFNTTSNLFMVDAQAVLIRASQGIRLESGASYVEITPAGIAVKGPVISSQADAQHEIKGLPVNINCD